MSKLFFLIAACALIAAARADSSANDIDACIQRKLKLESPVSHKQIQSGDFTKIPYATRSALQICHPTFDTIAGNVFKRMMRPPVPPTELALSCFKAHLLRKNAEGKLAATFNRRLLDGFEGDAGCAQIVDAFTDEQVAFKMPRGSPGELQCLRDRIDEYMSARFKALILGSGQYDTELVNDEKARYAKELRDVSEYLIECIVALQ